MKLDVIRAIEACYAGEEQDAAWLRGIVEALAPLEDGSLCAGYRRSRRQK